MIISISGRKGSGKSELAKICIERGFIPLKFADSLKDLVCHVLDMDRQTLEIEKETVISYTFSEINLNYFEEYSGIPFDYLRNLLLGKVFTSAREILQYVGTEVIRNYNPNWHSDKLRAKIEEGKNYVVDDMRFLSEKNSISDLDVKFFFIIRPANFEYSNHSSEISLNWSHFEEDKVLINNFKLNLLQKKWSQLVDSFLDNKSKVEGFSSKSELRKFLAEELKTKSTSLLAKELGCSRDKIVWWADKLFLKVSRENYNYNTTAFLRGTEEDAYIYGLLLSDGCVKFQGNYRALASFSNTDLELVEKVRDYVSPNKPIYHRKNNIAKFKGKIYDSKDSYDFDFENAFILDNLKLWNLKPTKSTIEEVPDIIKNNIEAIKQWIVGLIDGDGSIYVDKTGRLNVKIMCSSEVVKFINSICPIDINIHNHKCNLFVLNYSGSKAVEFYKWINPKFGLRRKWSIIENYVKNLEVRTV